MTAFLLAGRYSLLEQPALDRFWSVAIERGVGVMLGGVFNSGILATGAIAGARYNYRPVTDDVLAARRRDRSACVPRMASRSPRPRSRSCWAIPRCRASVPGAVAPGEVLRNLGAVR